jgi:hypothetical protein
MNLQAVAFYRGAKVFFIFHEESDNVVCSSAGTTMNKMSTNNTSYSSSWLMLCFICSVLFLFGNHIFGISIHFIQPVSIASIVW